MKTPTTGHVPVISEFKFEASHGTAMLMHFRDGAGRISTWAIPKDSVADWIAIQIAEAKKLGLVIADQRKPAN